MLMGLYSMLFLTYNILKMFCWFCMLDVVMSSFNLSLRVGLEQMMIALISVNYQVTVWVSAFVGPNMVKWIGPS